MRYSGLDPSNPVDAVLLEHTQAGILKGHGRNFTSFVFVRAEPVREFSRRHLASLRVQSSQRQYQLARQAQFYGRAQEPFETFFFSATGFRKLELDDSVLPRDIAFRRGMKHASRSLLGDPAPSEWDMFFRSDIDFLSVIAADDRDVVRNCVNDFTNIMSDAFGGHVATLVIESETLRNSRGQATDVFGFADGISQPLFLKNDIDSYFQSVSNPVWDPSFDPRQLVLVPDLVTPRGFGSYAVFRKLRQDRQRFDDAARRIEEVTGAAPEFAQAQIFGRFKNGTPIALSGREEEITESSNNFTYDNDQLPARCPMHAHVRKANLRSADPHFLYRQIARRGVPFQSTSEDEGLLFLCYQQDIGRQFEFQQSSWMNEPLFPDRHGDVGCDPVTMTTPRSHTAGQKWHPEWSNPATSTFAVESFVQVQGGEYFYAPPPQFLSTLSR